MRTHLTSPAARAHAPWFPGRLVGGVALVVAPVVWLVGIVLRWRVTALLDQLPAARRAELEAYPVAVPEQLAAYQLDAGLVTAAYAVFLVGALLLWPAVWTVAGLAARRCPVTAYLGAALFVLGLFPRMYFAGVEQTSFLMLDRFGYDATVDFVLDRYAEVSYGPWWVPVTLSALLFPGALLLAYAAFRSATLGLAGSLALLVGLLLWQGVLKEIDGFPYNPVLLCLVLVPLGVLLLAGRVPVPGEGRRRLRWLW